MFSILVRLCFLLYSFSAQNESSYSANNRTMIYPAKYLLPPQSRVESNRSPRLLWFFTINVALICLSFALSGEVTFPLLLRGGLRHSSAAIVTSGTYSYGPSLGGDSERAGAETSVGHFCMGQTPGPVVQEG